MPRGGEGVENDVDEGLQSGDDGLHAPQQLGGHHAHKASGDVPEQAGEYVRQSVGEYRCDLGPHACIGLLGVLGRLGRGPRRFGGTAGDLAEQLVLVGRIGLLGDTFQLGCYDLVQGALEIEPDIAVDRLEHAGCVERDRGCHADGLGDRVGQ